MAKMGNRLEGDSAVSAAMGWLARHFGRGRGAACALGAWPACTPPPLKFRREAEPVSAYPRITPRRLNAAFAGVFLLALAAALAPQTAQAQSITLTATPGNGKVDLSWTWTGITGQIRWQYRVSGAKTFSGTATTAPTATLTGLTNGAIYQIELRANRPGGIHIATSNRVTVVPNDLIILSATGLDSKIRVRWAYHGSQVGSHWEHQTFEGTGGGPWKQLADYTAARSADIENLVNGRTYNIAIRYMSGGGGAHAHSVIHNLGWVSAVPRGSTPTLTSDPDKTVTVGSADATTLVCFNLLSVKQVRGNDNLVWLQQRTGGNSYINRLANLEGNNRVAITQAPAGITTGLGVNLFPCATLGVGAHTVTWSWKGRDGTAVAGTTSTTVTVTEKAASPKKTITLSASPSATITEGDSGSTDVTITFTLSEPAPTNFSVSLGYPSDIGTATASGKGRDPCDPPLLPKDTDVCLPNGVIVPIAEGQTQGTKVVRILGDTRDEPDETINLIGYEDGWATGRLTLTIRDDDEAGSSTRPAKPTGFTAVQGSGNGQAVLSWTNPNDASITRWRYSQDGAWRNVPGSSATTITHTVTGLSTGTAYAFKVRAVNANGAGVASSQATVTMVWKGVPSKPSGLSAEAGVGQVTLSWDAQPNQRIARWGHQRRASGGAWPASATFVAGTGAATSRTITGLTAGTAYEFRIRASQGAGNNGPWSDVVTATPFAASTPRVVVAPTALTINEGSSGTYAVNLNTAPAANVTVTVGGQSGEVTVTGSPLTFTPGNYGTAQTVTVNAGTDDDRTNDTATLTHTSASSDSNYGSSLRIDNVTVTVTDTTRSPSAPTDDGDGGDVGSVGDVVEVVGGGGVSFPDAGLARVVARALGATDLTRSNKTEVALLSGLNATRSGVADLTGLEIALSLKSLNLSGNRISDLTPLVGLTRLGNLDLSSNRRIMDLTPLSGLALLETLRLDRTGVSDLTPLVGLVRLKTLNLSWNRQIVDLSPLSELILLETLRLDGIGASDLTPLAGLIRLETLTLSSNRQIVDLSPLSGLTMLETLRLDHIGVTDFSLLSAFAELRTLSLSGNGITDLSPLQALLKLSFLHLGANQIEDVSLLADLTTLRSLSLNDNRITDVSALAALPRLASLNLNGNPLSGFPSTGFRQLRGLYLRDCGLVDIGALANLTQIETLFLDGNGISNLSPLSSFSGLTKLFLARNAVSDLTPLSQLAALRQLVLDDNSISDVSALSSLSSLTKLFLARNKISNLTPLLQLAELEQLVLDGNDVADVSALSGLQKLELLSLGQNQVADIAALAELPALEYLDLRDNPLDPDALSIHIPALEERGVQVLY